MTKKTLILSTIILGFQINFLGQQLNDSIFHILKTKIESSDFPPFEGGKIKFNRTNYVVKTNDKKDTLIIERIKIVENGYSDPTNDKEIRSVALRDIDFQATAIMPGDGFFFLEIYTNDKQNLINYQLIKSGRVNSVVNNKIGIGRFSKSKNNEKDMQEFVDLFNRVYN